MSSPILIAILMMKAKKIIEESVQPYPQFRREIYTIAPMLYTYHEKSDGSVDYVTRIIGIGGTSCIVRVIKERGVVCPPPYRYSRY
jgi:hypothetical protein